ncbi:hypothetical protein [Tellurirhabdus bombi]|uniref:hypothetical protein n=1 Tax=Tellurirhabdus bombi TaxID=2907205 RepID=UPI001F24A8E8|nr:hypothetical protein [Tellurirhabdus bombi]
MLYISDKARLLSLIAAAGVKGISDKRLAKVSGMDNDLVCDLVEELHSDGFVRLLRGHLLIGTRLKAFAIGDGAAELWPKNK